MGFSGFDEGDTFVVGYNGWKLEFAFLRIFTEMKLSIAVVRQKKMCQTTTNQNVFFAVRRPLPWLAECICAALPKLPRDVFANNGFMFQTARVACRV